MPKPVLLLIVIVIALIAFALIWFSAPAVQEQPVVTSDDLAEPGSLVHDPEGTSQMRIGDNAVFIADQRPNGTPIVGLVALGADGFVAIHELNADGFPDAVLGTSGLLSAGEHSRIEVVLSRPLVEGERLVAMLHFDDGDGDFDVTVDPAVRTEEGIISMEFGVSRDANPGVEVTF